MCIVLSDSSCNWQVTWQKMSRVYVGNLDPRVSERELEDEFRVFGVIRRYGIFNFVAYCFIILRSS